MAKNIKGGHIAHRSQSATMFINMDGALTTESIPQFKSTIPDDQLQYMPWSPWGKNNLFPQEMVMDIETCGILNSIIDGKARFALCEGMAPAIVRRDQDGKRIIEKFVDDPEIKGFLEMNNAFDHTFGWMRDQIGLGNGVARILLDKGRNKIVSFMRHDVSEMRFQKKDQTTGKINNVYFSAEWAKVRGEKDNRLLTVPLLDPNNPLQDLNKRKRSSNEFAIAFKYPGWSKHYYSTPLWYAAHKWVKIAQGVPEMKAAMYSNTMVLKYMVIIQESFWEKRFGDEWKDYDETNQEKSRNELYDEIDEFLVGAENAHKSIFVNGYRDPITGHTYQDIEIKAIEGNSASGEYLPDSAAANSEIAFANLFNPAIIGASLPSGPYTNSQGGSNVQESVLLQIILHELERHNIARVMNVIKYFNGWDKKYPGLEFIIPTSVLTSLYNGNQKNQTNPPSNPNK